VKCSNFSGNCHIAEIMSKWRPPPLFQKKKEFVSESRFTTCTHFECMCMCMYMCICVCVCGCVGVCVCVCVLGLLVSMFSEIDANVVVVLC